MANNKAEHYKKMQIKTASQEKMLLMLYQGTIKFLNLAKEGIEEGNVEKKNEYLQRSQAIINELQSTLDFEAGGEIAQNLEQLYDFMNRQLIAANIQNKVELVEEVRGLMKELLETWEQVIEQQKQGAESSINLQG